MYLPDNFSIYYTAPYGKMQTLTDTCKKAWHVLFFLYLWERNGQIGMQIVVLDGHSLNPGDLSWEGLRAFGTVSVYDRTPEEFVAQRLIGADAVFTNKAPIREADLVRARNLKFICVLATGHDIVDSAAAARRGITVCNIPAYSTDAVVQHTFALLLSICSQVSVHDREVHRGRWTHCADFCFWDVPLKELSGKTFGVLGCGAIGCGAARAAQAFGMRVIGCSRGEHPDFCGERVDFETLLAESDVLSLHCPATEETRGIICRENIDKMKDGAILLNTARGALCVAQDVADALESGKLYACAVDVAEREPIARSDPLLTAKNCIITPHIAWAPLETRRRLLEMAAENLCAFLAGTPIHCVNGSDQGGDIA